MRQQNTAATFLSAFRFGPQRRGQIVVLENGAAKQTVRLPTGMTVTNTADRVTLHDAAGNLLEAVGHNGTTAPIVR